MKSLNAITKRNCSQIIQASGELPIYPFFCPGNTETMCALHHFGILIIGLGVPHQKEVRPRSARGSPGAPVISGWLGVHTMSASE